MGCGVLLDTRVLVWLTFNPFDANFLNWVGNTGYCLHGSVEVGTDQLPT